MSKLSEEVRTANLKRRERATELRHANRRIAEIYAEIGELSADIVKHEFFSDEHMEHMDELVKELGKLVLQTREDHSTE